MSDEQVRLQRARNMWTAAKQNEAQCRGQLEMWRKYAGEAEAKTEQALNVYMGMLEIRAATVRKP